MLALFQDFQITCCAVPKSNPTIKSLKLFLNPSLYYLQPLLKLDLTRFLDYV